MQLTAHSAAADARPYAADTTWPLEWSRWNIDAKRSQHWEEVRDLHSWANRLLSLAEDILASLEGQRFEAGAHYPFMLVSFMCKQAEHMDAMVVLERRRDTSLIARSMMEGMCLLEWVDKKPEDRARKWYQYGYVHDWRVIQERLGVGDDVDEELLSRVRRGVCRFGRQFLDGRRVDKLRAGGKEGDPYVLRWTGRTIRAIFKDTGYLEKYNTFYGQFSDWHHWNYGGVRSAFAQKGPELTYHPTDPQITASALVNGVQALFSTLHLADKRLSAGFADELARYHGEYLGARERFTDQALAARSDAAA